MESKKHCIGGINTMKQYTPKELAERHRLIREGRAKDTAIKIYTWDRKRRMQGKVCKSYRGHDAVAARLNG